MFGVFIEAPASKNNSPKLAPHHISQLCSNSHVMGESRSLLRDSDVYEGYWLQTCFFYKHNFGSLRLNILVLEEYAYTY